jgi:glycosyltransferase involved in cell wall biosynthesis
VSTLDRVARAGAPKAGLQLAALVPYALDMAPSQRFRIEQWCPHLAAEGIDVELHPFASPGLTRLLERPGGATLKAALMLGALGRRARLAARIPRGQIILVHRAACLAGPPVLERLLRRRGHRLIYDFDDAIYILHTAAANRALAWLKQPGKTATLCRLSDHVVVGNSHLAGWASSHNPRVTVVPTSVDTDRARPRPIGAPRARPVVGWTGSSTSQTYLEAFAPMLRDLAGVAEFELRVLSPREPDLLGAPHVWRRWSPGTELDEIADLDIGIMPMPDEEWALGKCALKALQYMAAGVPTVASAVGANREVIAHGVNGMLAATVEQWHTCLRALIAHPDLRARLGREGRRTVEERYSMRQSAQAFAAVVRAVAGP